MISSQYIYYDGIIQYLCNFPKCLWWYYWGFFKCTIKDWGLTWLKNGCSSIKKFKYHDIIRIYYGSITFESNQKKLWLLSYFSLSKQISRFVVPLQHKWLSAVGCMSTTMDLLVLGDRRRLTSPQAKEIPSKLDQFPPLPSKVWNKDLSKYQQKFFPSY